MKKTILALAMMVLPMLANAEAVEIDGIYYELVSKIKDALRNKCDVTSCVSSLSVFQLTDRQKHICKMIRNNPHISVKEMSLVLSLIERTVKRDLAALQKIGLLIREGNTSAGRWVLLEGKQAFSYK